jgi:hypothetical protein
LMAQEQSLIYANGVPITGNTTRGCYVSEQSYIDTTSVTFAGNTVDVFSTDQRFGAPGNPGSSFEFFKAANTATCLRVTTTGGNSKRPYFSANYDGNVAWNFGGSLTTEFDFNFDQSGQLRFLIQTSTGFLGVAGVTSPTCAVDAPGAIRTRAVAVGSLPSAATVGEGGRHFVTDSNATLAAGLGNVVAAGGSNKVPVYSDGTSWIIG